MAAAAPLAVVALPEAVKLASSVTAHIAAALGTPLLGTETTTTRYTKRGNRVTVTRASIPAWAAVAGGLMLLSLRPRTDGGGGGTFGVGGSPVNQFLRSIFDPLKLNPWWPSG